MPRTCSSTAGLCGHSLISQGKLRNNKTFGNKMDEETAAGLLRLRKKHEGLVMNTRNSSVDTLCGIDSYDALDALLQEEVPDDTALHRPTTQARSSPSLSKKTPSKPGNDK